MPSFEDGVVAQLVEQRTENPCVTGSIPVDATSKTKESLEHVSVQGFFFFRYRTFIALPPKYRTASKSFFKLLALIIIYDAVNNS